MEELIKKAKNKYANEQYHKNPENQKRANEKYWKNKAIEYFNTENVTEEDISKVKNMYYKKYRKNKERK